MVANDGLEMARAYLDQVPRDRQLNVPSEIHAIFSAECTLKEEQSLLPIWIRTWDL